MPQDLTKTSSAVSLLEDLLPRPVIFPGEDSVIYDGLREALLHNLAPSKPYEWILAGNLIMLEWEALRHRRMRDDLVRARARDLAAGAFAEGVVGGVYRSDAKWKELATDLFGSDPERADAATKALSDRRIPLGEILAKAYSQTSEQVEVHERALPRIETRRRRLREDYDHLRSARAKPVEDAEIVDE